MSALKRTEAVGVEPWNTQWAAQKAAEVLRYLGRNYPECLENLRVLDEHEAAAHEAAMAGDQDAYLEALRCYMDIPIGAALNRNLGSLTAPGEAVEAELDRLITRRHDARVSSEGERQAEEMWQESVKRYEEERLKVVRLEWHAFHCGQAERHRATLQALIEHHESEAARLMEATNERSLG